MNILAVDDKKMPLEALAEAIRRAEPEAEIHGFRSGAEVLAYSGLSSCETAFLDIDMRDMNGIQLAKKLKLKNPRINIIFATGYSEYAIDALELHCSGYLMKPITAEKVRCELDNLRYPAQRSESKRVRFQTFGNFEVFIDGKPINFKYDKTKEMLAYLVDRGTLCTNGEIMAVLWEEEVSSSYIRMLRKDLLDVFREAGCGEIFVQQRGKLGIVPEKVECDYYDWQTGLPQALNAYRGEYMSQYGWGEFTRGSLED